MHVLLLIVAVVVIGLIGWAIYSAVAGDKPTTTSPALNLQTETPSVIAAVEADIQKDAKTVVADVEKVFDPKAVKVTTTTVTPVVKPVTTAPASSLGTPTQTP